LVLLLHIIGVKKTVYPCRDSTYGTPLALPPNAKEAVSVKTKQWFNCKKGYAAKDNTRITCANNNRWYAEKDFKQLDALDNAKVSQLLECITCQDSWEDIKNWYRVSGQFENEVIVEGDYLDIVRLPSRKLKKTRKTKTTPSEYYEETEKYNSIAQYVTFHCPDVKTGKGFLSFNGKTFRSPPIQSTTQKEKKVLNCICKKGEIKTSPTTKTCHWYQGGQKVDMTFFADIKCTIDGGYGQYGFTPAP